MIKTRSGLRKGKSCIRYGIRSMIHDVRKVLIWESISDLIKRNEKIFDHNRMYSGSDVDHKLQPGAPQHRPGLYAGYVLQPGL